MACMLFKNTLTYSLVVHNFNVIRNKLTLKDFFKERCVGLQANCSVVFHTNPFNFESFQTAIKYLPFSLTA